jgi:L-2,4-diaminobutyrate decarboxylase
MSTEIGAPGLLPVVEQAPSRGCEPTEAPSQFPASDCLDHGFAAPRDAVVVYRTVREILHDVFSPEMPFDPAEDVDLSLDRPRAGSLGEILAEVRAKVVAHAVHLRSPLALAHMVPPPATVSVVADLLIGALNQCAFIWEEAPAAAALESEVMGWMAARLGFGAGSGGLLTSGGTMSNYLAALLALNRARRDGRATPGSCIIASDQAHLSVEKCALMLGLGREAVVRVETDAQSRTLPGSFRKAAEVCRAAGRTPFLFLCTAGTPSTGALEPVAEVLRVARDEGAWCHVDAAHAGFVSMARGYRGTVATWSAADSVSWDPHKSLWASFAVGALLLRDRKELRVLRFNGDYALKRGDLANAGEFHLDGSRRLEALKLWMCIRYFGIEGYSELAERSLAAAHQMAERIRETRNLALVAEPETNVVCFRFEDPTVVGTNADDLNLQIQASLFRGGGPLLSTTRVGGRPCLRAVLLNPNITGEHVVEALDRVVRAGKRLAAGFCDPIPHPLSDVARTAR